MNEGPWEEDRPITHFPVILFSPTATSERKAIFLDRDGVLTREKVDYVKNPDELEILPGVEWLRILRDSGFMLIVVTNQSVVNRGLASEEMLHQIHDRLRSELAGRGCILDAIYYCPHRPDEECSCRKPATGMLVRAPEELNIDLSKSWLIGDKDLDEQAAIRAGCKSIRIKTNSGELFSAIQLISQSNMGH